jgi:DNA gyrase subunit A
MTDDTTTPVHHGDSEVEITHEMEQSFIDYAMSVIVSRALPDVRDGLKPVQRRIVYSMFENNIGPGSAHRKCSKVVGDVMGNYHPHGDQAIYDALVRMGQDFSMRHLLIDPQGNFGTIDDPPGAARYTECRLTKLSTHLLEGIKEDTVDFVDNYSGEMQQPAVLPARFPNLLVNGSQGIAVGMATNIPPHNLNEVVDACLHTIANPDASAEELMQFIKGPDFPTSGFLVGAAGIRDALTTGRGSVKIRAACDIQEVRKGRTAIVVTELPYQVSIERVIAKIKDLVDAKKINGIAEVRNESSDRVGTRLVIELKQNAVPQVVLNQLYKGTPLQDSFGYNMVSLVDGVPRTLNISEMIGYYLDHQMEVIERRTQFRLDQAEARAHILEGLIIAVDNIDEVIKIIRGSQDTTEARANLIERFQLSEVQANSILDMPLRRLTALEVDKLRSELAELHETIAELKAILADPKVRWKIISDELTEIKENFGEPRRSKLIPDEGDLSLEDLIADDELIVTVSEAGYVKSVPASTYKTQGRGGRGVKAAEVQEEDVVRHLVHTTAHAYLLFFSNKGLVHRIKAHSIPRQSRTAQGVMAQSVLPLEPEETIQAVIDTRDYETGRYLVMVTKNGQAKKTEFQEYDSRNSTLVAINLTEGDELVSVRTTNGQNDFLIFTRDGQGIRFAESDLRPMGRATQGVRGIKLREGDEVVGAVSDVDGDELLLLTSGGYGKRTAKISTPLQTPILIEHFPVIAKLLLHFGVEGRAQSPPLVLCCIQLLCHCSLLQRGSSVY